MASTKPPARRGTWDVGTGDPATVLAEARKALFVMVGFLAIIWIVQLANAADHYQLTLSYGIRPRDAGSLPDVLTAPFLHFSWAHIEGNSGPLFIFGFLAAYRGVTKFFGVTALVILTSGLAAWLTESTHSVGAGASGVVFGYFGYIMVRGILRPARHRPADRRRDGVVLRVPVLGAAAAGRHRLAGAHRRPSGRHPGGLALPGAAAQAASAAPAVGTSRAGTASPADGPRADLHKQLDDLGL